MKVSQPEAGAGPGVGWGGTGPSQGEMEELEALLGVEFPPPGPKGKVVECGQTPPHSKRFTEWNNFATFTFTGYVAKVTRSHCECCDNLWDTLEGVFTEETKAGAGGRRLTQLGRGGNWPIGQSHRKEVLDVRVPYCGHCIGDLGFDREVDAKGAPYSHILKEG